MPYKNDEWNNKPFVEYAAHIAKELYEEGFYLLEGCDEPDFSAIAAICDLCADIKKIAEKWKVDKYAI